MGVYEVCLLAVVSVASVTRSEVVFIDTGNSFSAHRVSKLVNRDASSKDSQRTIGQIMRSISCYRVFDVFTLFDVLDQIESKLRFKVQKNQDLIKLLIVDSISSLITPILGGSGPNGYSALRVQTSPLFHATKPNPSSSILLAFSQKRWASNSAASSPQEDAKISIGPQKRGDDEEEENDVGVAYYGPISSTIKKVKLISISTCCLSMSFGPVITFMTSTQANVIFKGAIAATFIILSASTTAALHWFVSPYIHKIRWQPGSDSFEVEMLSWLATSIPRTIKFSDIRHADTNRPYVTFMENNNFYFVDADHCPNKALLAKLTPQKPTHESAFKNL